MSSAILGPLLILVWLITRRLLQGKGNNSVFAFRYLLQPATAMASGKNDTGTRRIMQELNELEKDDSREFVAEPCEDNLRDWHFAIKGPSGTAFEGGIYHGRLHLPVDYPFKPPRFELLTPNGRFEVHQPICLSISSYHPEHWQPSWGIRTALLALIAFMPSPSEGAVGSLDYPAEERQELAKKSRQGPPRPPGGSEERTEIMNRLHERLLTLEGDSSCENPLRGGEGQGEAASASEGRVKEGTRIPREGNGRSDSQGNNEWLNMTLCLALFLASLAILIHRLLA